MTQEPSGLSCGDGRVCENQMLKVVVVGGAAPYLYFPLSISLHNAQPWRGVLLCSPHRDEKTEAQG